MKTTTAQFQKGMFLVFKHEPHMIVSFQHVNPGKGSAFVRTRLKSVKTGRVQEFTYKSGEAVEELFIETCDMQYLYKDADTRVFMDNKTFDQIAMPEVVFGDFAPYLKEGESYQIMVHEGEGVGMRFPKRIELKVIEAAESTKGNTATAATKTVTLETGATINVPLFIKEGDTIAINPETSQYLERA